MTIQDTIRDVFQTTIDTITGLGIVGADAGTRVGDIFGGYTIDDNTLGQSQYNFTHRAFPSDLGQSYVGHYMVISIKLRIF